MPATYNFARGGAAGGGGAAYTPPPPAYGPIGGTARAYEPAYGGIPNVPSLAGSQAGAISSNIANLQNLYGLTTGLDTASGAGAMKALEAQIPGVSGSIGSARGKLDELISGKLPADVIAQLAQGSAEIGAGRGMGPMAPATSASYLRALGLNSLGMTQSGLSGLNALMGSVPRAPLFDPSSQLISPNDNQQWNYLANVLRAAPEPGAAARANTAALRAGIGVGGSGGGGGGWTVNPGGGPHPGTDSLGFPIDPAYSSYTGPGTFSMGATPGGLGTTPANAGPTALPPGLSYGANGGWTFDPTVGAYVNQATGQISDQPGGTPWGGFSQGGVNAEAPYPTIQDEGYAGPMTDYGAYPSDTSYDDYYGY